MPFRLFIAGVLFLIFQGCAKIGSPTGGPEDVFPPEYVNGVPENRSLNFNDDQVDIYFNEYIQLKDQSKEILVSPPMTKKPLIRVREKSIRISFNEDLAPSTTYTINFGKSLSDLNESNMLPDFDFVFSTGDVIDSLSVTGKVLDAFTHNAEKELPLLVMLYENLSDSAPLLEIPKYYGKSNENGLFSVNNIHPDTFRIVAIKDANNNLKYDQGIESIAFSDSLLIINASNVHSETFIKDTVKIITPVEEPTRKKNKQDTIAVDTIIAPGKTLHAVNISLYSFIEENNKVFVTSREREEPRRFRITFSRPLFDSLQIETLNFRPDSNWYIQEPSRNNDTLTYWITDTLIANMDTLRLRFTYTNTDSLGNYFSKSDTVRLRKPLTGKGQREGRRRVRNEEAAESSDKLIIAGSVSNRSTLHLNTNPVFTASRPVVSLNADSIELYRKVDTIFISQPLTLIQDTSSLRKFTLVSKWEEVTQYKILMKPGTVSDIFGSTNDSTEIQFTTQEESFYGTILLNFSAPQYPVIVQVLNEKSAVVRYAIAEGPGIMRFGYVPPGRYNFKAIYDENKNGRWDTGNYLKSKQPEKIFLSGKPEQLRSNWDWEPSWTISAE